MDHSMTHGMYAHSIRNQLDEMCKAVKINPKLIHYMIEPPLDVILCAIRVNVNIPISAKWLSSEEREILEKEIIFQRLRQSK